MSVTQPTESTQAELLQTRTIPLTQGKVAIVDACDYDYLTRYKWFAAKCRGRWYAITQIQGAPLQGIPHKRLRMHRVILNAPNGVEVDHKDSNGLNNTRANIRLATTAQNQHNAKMRIDNTSGFKGITAERLKGQPTGKWRAAIKHLGRDIHLGVFTTKIEAAKAYDAKATELFGEFARPNFPQPEQQ